MDKATVEQELRQATAQLFHKDYHSTRIYIFSLVQLDYSTHSLFAKGFLICCSALTNYIYKVGL